jgi:hypothetical protein
MGAVRFKILGTKTVHEQNNCAAGARQTEPVINTSD